MKAILLGLVALCAQVGLAVPHDHHQHRHPARAEATKYNTVTDVVTVTASNAVVWVDQHGNILSTDYLHQTTGAPGPSISTTPAAAPVPVTTSTPPPNINKPIDPAPKPSSSVQPPIPQVDNVQPNDPPANAPTTSNPPAAQATSSNPPPAAAPSAVTSSPQPATDTENKVAGDLSGLGVCYELIDSSVQCKSQDTMNSEFGFLKSQGFTKVRVYDIGCPLGAVAAAAASQGLSLVAGINTVSNVGGDIQKLIGMFNGNWAAVHTIVVGNEVVNGNPGLLSTVITAIGTARALLSAAGFDGYVVTVDTFIAHASHPELCAASDYCAVNAHAFFDTNTSAGEAGDFVLNTAIKQVESVAGGKPIVVTESGWPYKGSPNGQAEPSVGNQQLAIASLKSKVANSGIGLFLFQAYDATYKQPGALGVEQFFGIYGH